MVHVNRKLNTVPSTELGFTGDSTQWFDEEAYRFPKSKASFDEAGKHDYYFNSYSSHHIHEEMLKDAHRTNTYREAIEGNKNQAESSKDLGEETRRKRHHSSKTTSW